MDTIISSSPKSQEFIFPTINENKYEQAEPIILTEPSDKMEFTQNIIMIYQYPPRNKLFVPTYISSDYQTHYGIYKLENNKLKLLFQRLQIISDGFVYYYIDRDITDFLHELGLKKSEIEIIKNKKYKFEK